MGHTNRIFNFAAGPAVMPEPVLKQAQQDIWNIAESGIGVMEHSHRGPVFDAVINNTVALCRELANIPDNYEVLFLTGGASSQFFMVPMNLLTKDRTADYINTGSWSKKAIKEAKLFGNVHVAASSEEANFNYIPKPEAIKYSDNPAYVHFTSNNTIFGTEFRSEPDVASNIPLICDASSDIFSRPLEISKYAMIYAGAQKNLGP
ncbi:MAG: 3-phosphoserine/phosphohydroxythreonine transaminase, partial [Planctomycetota bacterium]